jgi:hypothetical protein
LAREKAVDRLSMHAKDTAYTHRVEPPVLDQPPNRLGMHAELVRNLANADEPGFSAW